MIDINNAYIEFDKYTSLFNPEEGRIKLKIDHIKRVAAMSRKIAQYLKLDEEHVKLAELIGLFHDIGRFKQAQLYNTFNDRDTVNHAELSVTILFDENLIDNFNVDEIYKKIIKLAVFNHNKNKIDDGLTDEELLFAKIIRDADKLDIYYTICEYDFPSIFWFPDFNCSPISDIIMEDFINLNFVNYANIKSNSDQILVFYAYMYDFNFDFSLKYLKENKFLDKFTERVYENFENDVTKQQVKKVLDICNNFLNK